MKKLVFIMDDFGVHESVSYLVRDILRNKIQKMHDDWVEKNMSKQEDLEMQIVQLVSKVAIYENKLANNTNDDRAVVYKQGGADDSGRVASPTESIGGVRDIPDQN